MYILRRDPNAAAWNSNVYKLRRDPNAAICRCLRRDPNAAAWNSNVYKLRRDPNAAIINDANWKHGDFRDVAYFFNYKLYNDIVEKGDLP